MTRSRRASACACPSTLLPTPPPSFPQAASQASYAPLPLPARSRCAGLVSARVRAAGAACPRSLQGGADASAQNRRRDGVCRHLAGECDGCKGGTGARGGKVTGSAGKRGGASGRARRALPPGPSSPQAVGGHPALPRATSPSSSSFPLCRAPPIFPSLLPRAISLPARCFGSAPSASCLIPPPRPRPRAPGPRHNSAWPCQAQRTCTAPLRRPARQ